jgi:multiple antibiotic resistance protein
MIDTAFLISGFATLFVVMDPIGLVPLFIALTAGQTAAARQAIALRACGLAAVLLMLFGLTGDTILTFVGISMPAFRIAGGVLLFLTALDMLFDRRAQRREKQSAQAPLADDPSIFPLATPLIAGPGAIAAMILLIGQGGNDMAATGAVIGLMLGVLAITFALFSAASLIERALGPIGTLVVTRLLGMLLAALAVQFVLDGLRGAGVFG